MERGCVTCMAVPSVGAVMASQLFMLHEDIQSKGRGRLHTEGGPLVPLHMYGRFNDRPSRAGGSDPTQTWLNGIGATKANPVNAALVVDMETKSTKSVGKQVGNNPSCSPPPPALLQEGRGGQDECLPPRPVYTINAPLIIQSRGEPAPGGDRGASKHHASPKQGAPLQHIYWTGPPLLSLGY